MSSDNSLKYETHVEALDEAHEEADYKGPSLYVDLGSNRHNITSSRSPHIALQSTDLSATMDTDAQDSSRHPSMFLKWEETFPSTSISKNHTRVYKRWHRQRPVWWWWEIICSGVSIICLGLVVAILIHLDNISYTSWEYRLSPNAFLSLLVTISKAAMIVPISSCIGQLKWRHYHHHHSLYDIQMYDEASRGPYGALMMLISSMPSLATTGALLTVLSLAIDPFAQQIFKYPSRRALAYNETASVQLSYTYAQVQSHLEILSSSYDNSTVIYGLDPSMQLAILKGLLQAETSLSPLCPTGDCEYPDFTTMGFCSQCKDVTKDTTQNCTALESIAYQIDPIFNKTRFNCVYTTPGGVIITPILQPRWWPGYFHGFHDPWTSAAIEPLSYLNATGADIFDPMIVFGSAKYSTDLRYTADNATAIEAKPKLSECAIYLCEKKYEDNVINRTHPYLAQPRTQQLFLSPKTKSQYFFDKGAYSMLVSALSDILTAKSSDVRKSINGFSALRVLSNSEDLGETMEHLTTSMTDSIRTCLNSTTVAGSAWVDETYIHVRWVWIIMPALLIVLTTIFLGVTIFVDSRQPGTLWKSSALALLLYNVKTLSENPHMDSPMDLATVGKAAKGLKVTLEPNQRCLIEVE